MISRNVVGTFYILETYLNVVEILAPKWPNPVLSQGFCLGCVEDEGQEIEMSSGGRLGWTQQR